MKKHLILILTGILALVTGCSHSNQFLNQTPQPTAPNAPGGLTATAGDKSVVLSWASVSGAYSYNVYYSTTAGVTKSGGTKVGAGSISTYTVTGLTNGTTYYFVVTAVNAGGESGISTETSAKPVSPIPLAPAGLTATAGAGQVALAWTASSGATSYNVYYGTATGVTTANGTKVTGISATGYTVAGLTGGTKYFFIVTAVNASGESTASAEANATPTAGAAVSLTPGTPSSGTVNFSATNSLTFNFPANAVSAPADVAIAPVSQANLPLPLSRYTRAFAAPIPQVQANDTFVLAFELTINPTSITMFNVPVGIGGTVDPTVAATGVTLNLAILSGTGANQSWVDVATFVVNANGVLNQNLASTALAGLLQPGTYLLYMPAKGSSTAVSNLGVVLLADDGYTMADGKNGLQIIHLYDKNGALLTTPTISYLDYPNNYDLDGQALTPDGSQGVMVDGSNKLAFFSGVQTGVPIASTSTMDVSNWGYDGDSIGIMPNGDEAVVALDSGNTLLLVSGIVAGKPAAAEEITTPGLRDGVVISGDGKVLLARGSGGLTVYSIADITPVAGALGGTVSHSYTQVTDMTAFGAGYNIEDGRDGMAISPMDSTTAVVVFPATDVVQLITGLPAAPVAGPKVTLPSGVEPLSVSISADGMFAVVGTNSGGLFLFSGIDQGKLVQVGTAGYQPSYTLGTGTVTLNQITTLGITLDSKYVVAGDKSNNAIVVIPFSATGFATAPAAVLGQVAIPYNDQLLIH